MTKTNVLMAFYGDDFTGSTDALESLSLSGAKTVLFIQPPTPLQIARYEGLQAIGVAGMTRAMVPEKMEAELKAAFTALHELAPRHVHYKVCSTFDSSPHIGSIGKAIDTGAAVFRGPFVPLLVGAPSLGRYCVFGNLFARMGIGSTGKIFRLDRHPSMSKHPVTPADESDLRLHLSRQTKKQAGLVDILQIILPAEELRRIVDSRLAEEYEVVLFDALYEEHMEPIGRLIDSYAIEGKTLFSVGSSGIETALGRHWQHAGLLETQNSWADPGAVQQLLVVSGSCSPVTSMQIEWAVNNGFADIGIDTTELAVAGSSPEANARYVSTAVECITQGKSVIVHTSYGTGDPRVEETNTIMQSAGWDEATIRSRTAEIYGTALGLIARRVVEKTGLKRIVVAGGDTSSYAARAMSIEAVEMIAPLSPGAPLCKAYAPDSPVDQAEVNFKGGQVGREDYFGMVKAGKFVAS